MEIPSAPSCLICSPVPCGIRCRHNDSVRLRATARAAHVFQDVVPCSFGQVDVKRRQVRAWLGGVGIGLIKEPGGLISITEDRDGNRKLRA